MENSLEVLIVPNPSVEFLGDDLLHPERGDLYLDFVEYDNTL